jgi:hypothetical protein
MNIFNISEIFAKDIQYAPHFGLPGLPATTTPVNYSNVLPTIFKFIFGLGIVATVVSLIISGILYIFAGPAPSLVAKAKKRVLMSLIGLIILLLSNFIFNQINEELTMPKLKIVQISQPQSNSSVEGVSLPPTQSFYMDALEMKLVTLYLLASMPQGRAEVNVEGEGIERALIQGSVAWVATKVTNGSYEPIENCINNNFSGSFSGYDCLTIKNEIYNVFKNEILTAFLGKVKRDFDKIVDPRFGIKISKDPREIIEMVRTKNEKEPNKGYLTQFENTINRALGINSGKDLYQKVSEIFNKPHLYTYSYDPRLGGTDQSMGSFDEVFDNNFKKDNFSLAKEEKCIVFYSLLGRDCGNVKKISLGLSEYAFNYVHSNDFDGNFVHIHTLKEILKDKINLQHRESIIFLDAKFKQAFNNAANYFSYLPKQPLLKLSLTSAFPPIYPNSDINHYNGKAIDLSFNDFVDYLPQHTTLQDYYNILLEKFAKFIQGLAENNNIETIVFEYDEKNLSDPIKWCLTNFVDKKEPSLKDKFLKNELTLDDINNFSIKKNEDEFKKEIQDGKGIFCEDCKDKRCQAFQKLLYIISGGYSFKSEKLESSLKIENKAKKIHFATYGTTQGNPIHIEVK